jgi:hypothetical protein
MLFWRLPFFSSKLAQKPFRTKLIISHHLSPGPHLSRFPQSTNGSKLPDPKAKATSTALFDHLDTVISLLRLAPETLFDHLSIMNYITN